MANTMNMADLVASLKASLHDSAKVFAGEENAENESFERFLLQALPDMQVKCPVTRLGTITLQANFPRYAVGSNPGFAAFKTQIWGDGGCNLKPWDPAYPGPVPRVAAVFDENQWWLAFDPPPGARLISVYGSAFTFWYFATHTIGETAAETTINAQDRGLLLLRAQVEAMKELAIRNAGKPVQVRDGYSGQPRNSTAAALYKELLEQFYGVRK